MNEMQYKRGLQVIKDWMQGNKTWHEMDAILKQMSILGHNRDKLMMTANEWASESKGRDWAKWVRKWQINQQDQVEAQEMKVQECMQRDLD